MLRQFNKQDREIYLTYKDMRKKQNIKHYSKLVLNHCFNHDESSKTNIWDALEATNNFIDLSDPDMTLPNLYHMYQTAEGLRKDNAPDWMVLTGLIHDLGKILYLWGCDEDGTSLKKQWALVGDTFILGCPIPDVCVYPELNPKSNYDKPWGTYSPNCGLRNVYCSFGHDEYFYHILKNNKTKLPEEALYIIRYHSLYPWHTHDAYEFLEDSFDKKMKPMVQYFNKFDLYTKENIKTNIDKEYYNKLFEKYGLTEIVFEKQIPEKN